MRERIFKTISGVIIIAMIASLFAFPGMAAAEGNSEPIPMETVQEPIPEPVIEEPVIETTIPIVEEPIIENNPIEEQLPVEEPQNTENIVPVVEEPVQNEIQEQLDPGQIEFGIPTVQVDPNTCSHVYQNGVCLLCQTPCQHSSWTIEHCCSVCGVACAHSLTDGEGNCSTCGATASDLQAAQNTEQKISEIKQKYSYIIYDEVGDYDGPGEGGALYRIPSYTPEWRKSESCVEFLKVVNDELAASDHTEYPMGSRMVKYNTWFYDGVVEAIDPNKSWDAVFVSYCANSAGLLEDGFFAKTSTAQACYDYMVQVSQCETNGVRDAIDNGKLKIGDLWFVRNYAGVIIRVGVVDQILDTGEINVVFGDFGGKVDVVCYNPVNFTAATAAKDPVVVRVIYNELVGEIYRFCRDELYLNNAAILGILANMAYESGFNIHALGDGGTSFGLCQWHSERWTNMVEFCEANGYDWSELEGQLQFLKYEFQNYEQDVYTYLLNVEDTAEGCYQATEHFCTYFEKPAGLPAAAYSRAAFAVDQLWSQI